MKALIIALSLLSLEAFANNCAQDVKKYCPGIDPGRGQIAQCLESTAGSLSPLCAKELKEFKAKTLKKNPCFEDLAQLCSDVPAEDTMLQYCLLKNESRLSQVCLNDFKKKKGNIIVKNVCAQDIVNNCYSQVTATDGSINHCLIQNRNKLSGFCKKNIDERITKIRKANPCFDDQQKFCPTQIKTVDIHDCLEKKLPSLAPNCKGMVQNEMKKIASNPCYKDLMRHCVPNLPPKEQGECLTLNNEHLTRACKDYRVKEDQKIKKMVELCEPDRLKFCKTALPQNGGIIKCLRQVKAKLQKSCADLI